MKKIIATIATLLALSMAFIGCNHNTPNNNGGNSNDVEDVELLTEDIATQGNVVSLAALKEYKDTYNTITITVKNENDEDRSYWGIVSLILTDAEDPWSWHGKIFGEGDYEQLPPAGAGNLEAGASYTYKFALADFITALETEETNVDDGKKHQLTIQTGEKCPITSVKLTVSK